MSSEQQQWENIRDNYLKMIQKNLAQVDHFRREEILGNVREHLESKYAELNPEQHKWENYQQIITEMGPPEEYAELLDVDRPPSSYPEKKFMVDQKDNFESSIKSQFILLVIFWWIGFPLSIIGKFIPSIEILGAMAMVTMTVFWCILLYRHWFVLQGHGARITPGRAVGFGFIPIYCFYWWFVAYVGLATDTNRYLEQIGITHCRMSRRLAIIDCVLSILCCTVGLIPVVGVIIMIPGMIVGYILVVQQRNCVLAILHYNTSESKI